jgi:hypothetical protein
MYLDLTALRKADLKNVRRRLQSFLWPSIATGIGSTTIVSSTADARTLALAHLKRLQRRLRRFIENRFPGSFAELVSKDISSARLSRGLRIDLVPGDAWDGAGPISRTTQVSFDGDAEDCFLLLLSLALAEFDAAEVRWCPGCRRLFRARRKQRYCSSQCGGGSRGLPSRGAKT